MKNKNKFLVPLLLASVVVPTMATVVQNFDNKQVVLAGTTTIDNITGGTLTIENIAGSNITDTKKVGEKVFLPIGKIDGVAVLPVVTKGVGDRLINIPIKNDDPAGKYFIASDEGYYEISFKDSATNRIVSKESIRVYVETSSAIMTLPSNSEYVIPAIVPTNKELSIPLPTVMVNGEEVLGDDLINNLTVLVEGSNTGVTFDAVNKVYKFTTGNITKTYEIMYKFDKAGAKTSLSSRFQARDSFDPAKEIALAFDYSGTRPDTGSLGEEITLPKAVVYNSKSGTKDPMNAYVEIKVVHEESGVTFEVKDYKFTPTKKGKYSVTYTAKIGLFGETMKSTSHMWFINGVEDKTAPTPMAVADYKLDENGVVSNIGGNYTFTGTGESAVATYNGGEAVTYKANASKYEKDRFVNEKIKNIKYNVPSVVVMGEKIALPAIYGSDSFAGVSDMTLSRYIVGNGYVTNLKNGADNIAKSFETAFYTFTKAGDYVVYYKAEDSYTSKTQEFKIKVVENLKDIKITTPTIIQNIASTIIRENTLVSFDIPTAKDDYDSYLDTRTYVVAGSSSSYIDDKGVISTQLMELTSENIKDGKYSFKLSDFGMEFVNNVKTMGNKFSIVTIAINDFYNINNATYKPAEKIDTMEVISTGDIVVPTMEGHSDFLTRLMQMDNNVNLYKNSGALKNGAGEYLDQYKTNGVFDSTKVVIDAKGNITSNTVSPFDQNSKNVITLPSMTFRDSAKNLMVSVSVYNPVTGKKENLIVNNTEGYDLPSIVMQEISANDYKYTVSGGAFRVSSAGYYKIEYKAIDVSGNIILKTFGLKVNDKTAPTVVVTNSAQFDKEWQVGELFEVPKASLQKNGATIGGSTAWSVTDKSEGGDFVEVAGTGYIFTKEGTYRITYTGSDEFGNVAIGGNLAEYTVTVKDKSKPVLKFTNTMPDVTSTKWVPNVVDPADNSKMLDQMKLTFSKASAIDNAPTTGINNYKGEEVNVTYKITDPNGKDVVIDYTENNGDYSFIAKSQGKYTIVYTAQDGVGNSISLTKNYFVGDCDAPTLTWKNKDRDLITSANLDSTFELITKGDNKFFDIFEEMGVDEENLTTTISLYGPDNKEVTNILSGTGYKWTFTQTGDYSLKILLKDKAGNTTGDTYKYVINVADEKPKEETISPIVGTVLIVGSVLVLIGVVIYFIVSSRKNGPKKVKNKKNK